MRADHFQRYVIAPTLLYLHSEIAPRSVAAEELLLGTALAETGLEALVQEGGGPGLGLYQIEPATHDDVWANWLNSRPDARTLINMLRAGAWDRHAQLVTNLAYATAIARIIYCRSPKPLPAAGDTEAQAHYWVTEYNRGGKGTVEHYLEAWARGAR